MLSSLSSPVKTTRHEMSAKNIVVKEGRHTFLGNRSSDAEFYAYYQRLKIRKDANAAKVGTAPR